MLKRSFRRLAVVTGAALAVGTMAPAMAAHVTAAGAGTASVNTVGITDVTSVLPPVALPTDQVSLLAGSLLGAPFSALNAVHPILDDAAGLGGGLFTGGLAGGLGVGLGAGATAGLGGVALGAAGIVSAPLGVLGAVTADGGIVDDTFGAGHGLVTGVALPLAITAGSIAVGTAFGAISTVAGLPVIVPGILSGVLGSSASVGVLAGVGAVL